MKSLLATLTLAVLATLPVQAKNIRVSCGIGGPANPHNGSMYIAVYKNTDMTKYRMLVLKFGVIQLEEDVILEESTVDQAALWPVLSATMRGEHLKTQHTFKLTVTKVLEMSESANDRGNYGFAAEGEFELSMAPGKKFALVCDGVFNRN